MAFSEGSGGYCHATGIYGGGSRPLPLSLSLNLPDLLLPNPFPFPSSKPAFIDSDSGESLTYADLRALTDSAAGFLASLGVEKGHVILLVAPNFLHFPVVVLAVMSLGAVLSTANFLHTREELSSQVEDSCPFLILTTEEILPRVEGLTPHPPLLLQHFILRVTLTEKRMRGGASAWAAGRNDPAAIMYSSGTTGKSKGVVCTHGGLACMSLMLREAWGGGGEEVYLCVVPLFHMFGFSVLMCGAMVAGATTVVMKRYHGVEEVVTAVERHGVTRLPVVPPMVVQMARWKKKRYDELGESLKEVICSGAPLGKEHSERFLHCYPSITLSQCYGLTETCGPITVSYGAKAPSHVSIGRLLPSVQAKIVDVHTGKSLPPNKCGELCIKGPQIMQGYLNNKEATSAAIDKEGWLHTGDLCYIDKQGLVYLTDRIKELIKYKAYQVAPVELEEILIGHPEVQDVAVIPYPDEEAGEIPMACIVKKEQSKLREEDIISFMEKKVAPYKKIRKVLFVKFIPRSPSGKILRRMIIPGNHYQNDKLEIAARL